MKKNKSILIIIGCLLILINLSIMGISAAKQINTLEIEKNKTQLESFCHDEPFIPHADANGPYSAEINEPILFSGFGSSASFYSIYKWDFGDGTFGYGKYPKHSYSKAGEYYVTLQVTTNNNDVYLDDTLVYIDQENDHLVPNGGCFYHADIGNTITFDGSESVSSDPNLPIVEYNWYFSDGTKKSGKKVTHSFEEEKVYMVTLYIKDKQGNVRRDILHADIGHEYSSKWDFYINVDSTLLQLLEKLFEGYSGYLLDYFDAKIYTNYNGFEKLIDINTLDQLPLYINVDDSGADDIILNKLKFFKPSIGPSLFGEGIDWWQFETTLSNIEKTVNSDIIIDDDFTICLQVNFGPTLAKWLGLDTPIIRVGYNSPSGEEMPDRVSLVHIFKPYFLQRWSEILKTVEVGSFSSEATVKEQSEGKSTMTNIETEKAGILNTDVKRSISRTSTHIINEGISEEVAKTKIENTITMENNEIEGYQQIVDINPYEVLEDEYAPEYGLRLDSNGGGRFSLVRMFLKSETNSNTGLFLSISLNPTGDESTYLVYKAKKDGGIFHRGVKFEIPGDAPFLSLLRKDNGIIKTELSTSISFSQDKFRKIIWDDAGASIKLESEASIGLQDFYFSNQNPELTINLDEITFDFAGSLELSLSEGIELVGEAGFSITNLNFNAFNFDASITGTLSVDISNQVKIGLYKEETEVGLKIGFTDALILSSNCIYKINSHEVTLEGVFTFTAADSEIRFALDNGVFIIRLMQGPSVEINNLYFKAGNLIALADYVNIEPDSEIEFSFDTGFFEIDLQRGPSITLTGFSCELDDLTINADNIEIGTSGRFFAEWDKTIPRVKLGGGTSSNLVIDNINAIFTNFEVQFDGQLTFNANGWIEFKPYNVGAGFLGMLDVDSTIIMDYLGNQQIVILKGILSLHEEGIVGFNWHNNIEISLSSGTGLTIDDFLFEIGDFSASATYIEIGADGVIELTKSIDQFKIDVGGGTSLEITDLDLEIEDLNAIASSIEIGLNGAFIVDWNMNNEITLTVGAEASTSIENVDISVINIIDFNTLGIFDVTAGGSVTFASSGIDLSVNGELGLSEDFEFTLNQVTVGISGNINADGNFAVNWILNTLTTAIDGDCNWDIKVDTENLGDWETIGNLNGDLSITTEKYTDGGLIGFEIYGTGTQNNLKIIHGDLTIELGAFNFDPGSIEFEWHREGDGEPGTLDITNSGISGTIASCKITYSDSDPIEIQLGSISSSDGVVNIIWYKDEFPHYIEIDSSVYLDVDPLKFTWDSKVLTFDAIEFEPGKFYLGWYDVASDMKILTIKNSIPNFGPGVSYEDTSQDLKLSATLGGLNDEYNTITLETFRDSNGDISGLYLDSGGEQLATWIQLEAIKGDTGRRIELDGLKVEDFYIKKLSNGKLDWGGNIWFVNGLVFSKMVDEDTWIDFEVNWNLAAEGEIEFIIDDGFEDDWEIDTKIKGADIDISVTDVAEYVRFAWDLENPLTTSGYVQIDTNSDPISQIDLTIKKDNLGYYPLWGIHTFAYGLAAEDYQIYWDFFAPPEEWILYETGWIQPGSIQDLDIGFLGNWYIIYDGGTRI